MTNPVIKKAFPTKMINLATTLTLPTETFLHNFAEIDVWSRPAASVTIVCCHLLCQPLQFLAACSDVLKGCCILLR